MHVDGSFNEEAALDERHLGRRLRQAPAPCQYLALVTMGRKKQLTFYVAQALDGPQGSFILITLSLLTRTLRLNDLSRVHSWEMAERLNDLSPVSVFFLL